VVSLKEKTLTSWLVLRDYPLLFPLKPLKRSMRSQIFSEQRYWLKLMLVRANHTCRPLEQVAILKIYLKSRKLFPLSRQRISTTSNR